MMKSRQESARRVRGKQSRETNTFVLMGKDSFDNANLLYIGKPVGFCAELSVTAWAELTPNPLRCGSIEDGFIDLVPLWVVCFVCFVLATLVVETFRQEGWEKGKKVLEEG
jgi:hypothetical protein